MGPGSSSRAAGSAHDEPSRRRDPRRPRVRHAYALVALALALFVFVSIVTEFVRGVRARRRNAGESVPLAFGRLIWRAPRRYGGYIIHVGSC